MDVVGVEPADAFASAAIEWAAGGPGQPLVDAAVDALVAGIDSPTLRILAGAGHANADAEATELAPKVFKELGMHVDERLSPSAIVAGARQKARRFLDEGGSPRQLAQDVWRMYVNARYPAELSAWAGLDDWYDMLDTGVIAGDPADAAAAVTEAARALVDGRPCEPAPLQRLFTGGDDGRAPTLANPATPATPVTHVTESRRLVRLWWVPLAFSAVVTAFIFVVALSAIGWEAFDPDFGAVFLFVAAVSYFCAGVAFAGQVAADWRERRRGRETPDRARMLADEQALIDRLVSGEDDADVRARRWLRRRLALSNRMSMVGHVLAVPAVPPLVMFALWVDWGDGVDLLSARWQHRVFVVGCVVSVAFAIFWLVTRLRGLLDDPILVDGAIAKLGAFEGEDMGEAALGASGVFGTNLHVDVRRAWRVAPDGLVALPWSGSHLFERTRSAARMLVPGEDAFLVCTSDHRAVGRLGELARRAPARTDV